MDNHTRAVIWDMDGVIADTAPYHFQAWRQAFQKRGVEFTEADFRRSFGQRNDNIIRGILGQQTSDAEIAAISPEKEATYRRLARHHQQAHPGAVAMLQQLQKRDYKIALASSAPPENIRFVLDDLGIGSYFQATVSGRDVTRGKPDPQVFLTAAQKLGVSPDRSVVIEDAVAGVAAAKRAGMACIAVTNTNSRESLHEADLIVDSLEQVTVADIDKLIDHTTKGY
jgi:beta-phosphoglucomutase family hydrolase